MTFDRDLRKLRWGCEAALYLNLGMAVFSACLRHWWHIPAWLIWAWNCQLMRRQVVAQQLTRDEARMFEAMARSIEDPWR